MLTSRPALGGRLKRSVPTAEGEGGSVSGAARRDAQGYDSSESDSSEDAEGDRSEDEASEDLYVRHGLRAAPPPAPLLSAAAAVGAVWTYCTEQSRPTWSTSHLPSERIETEQRAHDLSLAALESELALSRHETYAQKKPAAPVKAPEMHASTAQPSSRGSPQPPPPPHDPAPTPAASAAPTDNTPPGCPSSSLATSSLVARRAQLSATAARRHSSVLPSGVARATARGVAAASATASASVTPGALTQLVKSRSVPSLGCALNPAIRGATVRMPQGGIPAAPPPLREATGRAGLEAIAQRHGWKFVNASAAAAPLRVGGGGLGRQLPRDNSSRQFLASTAAGAAARAMERAMESCL